ncbi:MAG: hypothetical protein CME48_08560 [Halieaceae bacterium]|nr:hypothetical protein [Halieaceae bacterium]
MNLKKSFLFLTLIITVMPMLGQQIDPAILAQLSPAQLEMVKSVYGTQKTIDTNSKIEEIPVATESTVPNESIVDTNLSQGKYGYDFFSTMATTTSAVGDLPLPNDYKISFRDQLTVILSGSRDSIFDLDVKLDGTIQFPELGAISVVDKTLGEVKTLLTNLISRSFIGVEIDVSMKNLSAKKITVVGAVKTPGTFLVNPFSTITSALAYSGGISKIGTLRDIKLIRRDGTVFSFDLYDLLIKGDRSNDITIEAGDTILINAADQFVRLSGEVKRPAVYEVLKSEKIEDIIGFGLGFTDVANKSNISIEILDLATTSIVQENTNNLDLELKNVLSVEVFNYGNESVSSIQVLGAIEKPGFYDIKEFHTLEKLIDKLSFFQVYPWLAVLEQYDRDNNIKSSVLFNLNDSNTFEKVKLLPNSVIRFLSIDEKNPMNINSQSFLRQTSGLDLITREKIEEFSLRINHKNGRYDLPIYGKYDVKSLIDYLGLDMSDIDQEAIYVSPLDNLIEKVDYELMNYVAKKFNTVTFKSPINDLISVNISGAVIYPGSYTLNSDATIQDLYDVAGAFKRNAFLEGIIYIKESQKAAQIRSIQKARETLNESILVNAQKEEMGMDFDPNLLIALLPQIDEDYIGRVAGSFMPNSKSSITTVLNNGDNIIVPVKPSTVSVFGEVLNSSNIVYEPGIKVSDVISLAGGYKEYADKQSIYIIKANGLTEKVNKNIFVKNVVLEPGDTIIVPRKILISSPFIDAVTPLTQILSNLAFSAAAINNLSSN